MRTVDHRSLEICGSRLLLMFEFEFDLMFLVIERCFCYSRYDIPPPPTNNLSQSAASNPTSPQ